jgi:hypothetical protein
MAISIGQRNEDIECVPWQRQEIVWFRAPTPESRHGPSLSVFGIAINGIVSRWARASITNAVDEPHQPPMRFQLAKALGS